MKNLIYTLLLYQRVLYFKIDMKTLISAYISISGADDRDLGRQAIHLVVDEGYKIANVLPG